VNGAEYVDAASVNTCVACSTRREGLTSMIHKYLTAE